MTAVDDDLVYVRDLDEMWSTRRQYARAAAAGRAQRVSRGVYLPNDQWSQLSERDRYIVRLRGLAETRRFRPVLSHWSAAAVHGLPMLGAWPSELHTIVGPTTGGRSRNDVVKHSLRLSDEDVVESQGFVMTSVARTVVDLAASSGFMAAAAAADRAIHIDKFGSVPPLSTRDELFAALARARPFRGHARAETVIRFAETLAGSALETVSRVNMWMIGYPRPQLQASFVDHEGTIGDTDFFWREFRLIGEADGDLKYLNAAYRGGRTADEVKLAEKVREERLRALNYGVTRWRWNVGVHPARLRAHLERAGLPMGKRW